jgi:hypothetical protein
MRSLARKNDKDEILRRLESVRPESGARWGRMTAHQMVCHLGDSLRMVLGRKRAKDASNLLYRTVVKWIALYLPMPWPAGIRTVPEIDQAQGGTPPAAFAADVAQLLELVRLFTMETRSIEGVSHPTFGRMSDPAWLRWGYLHIDHHLRQFGA